MSLWKGSDITIELAGLPPLTLSLEDDGSPPSPILSALRPRVTLRRNGVVLVQQAPYGAPDDGVPWGLVFAGALLLGVLFVTAE